MIVIDEKQFAKGVIVMVVVIGLIVAVIVSWHLYSQTLRKLAQQKTASAVTQPSTAGEQSIIDKVGRHIVLPDEEGSIRILVLAD